jgi:hypothetical protein
MVSCNDDEKEKTDYAKEIVGNYKGAVTSGEYPLASDVTISIAHESENKVVLKLDETIAGIPIKIECKSDVIYSNNKYNISATTTFNEAPVTVEGDIDREGNAVLDIKIPAFELDVVFSGTKQ